MISAAARSHMTFSFSSSTGIFKQLDPENTGMIELDLISVSHQLTPTPWLPQGWAGMRRAVTGVTDLWFTDLLFKALLFWSVNGSSILPCIFICICFPSTY